MTLYNNLNIVELDGRIQSTLDWTHARKEASALAEAGKEILWKMELGLFSGLDLPLSNQMQLQSLNLSIEHFRETLWKDFQSQSNGLIIYSGELDFSIKFPWDEILMSHWQGWLQDRFETIHCFNSEIGILTEGFQEIHPQLQKHPSVLNLLKLFCRDSVADYLSMLAGSISDSLPLSLQFSVSEALEPLLFYQLAAAERFERFNIIFDQEHTFQDATLGICLPSADLVKPSLLRNLQAVIDRLQKAKIPFKVIPEDHLIQQWDGLEAIIYSSKCLGAQGKRKLQGFCAAAGLAVAVDEVLGLNNELSFEDYILNAKRG
jgi:hypothetical protein